MRLFVDSMSEKNAYYGNFFAILPDFTTLFGFGTPIESITAGELR